jgi:tripartite-type tricarboxylate transporter receptor subunit TctC
MRFLLLFLALVSLTGNTQEYPSRPVRLLVGFPPGGAMDAVARVLSPKLAEALGQQFVVDNRTGAGGAIAADALVKSAPDGHTLLLGESGTLIVPSINPKAAYDPVRQFAPVSAICSLPLAVVASRSFPAATPAEMIAILKASPGKYSYASPGIGTLQHLAFELLKREAGVEVLHVPYKGASAMMPDLMSGQVQVGAISALVAVNQSRAGAIKTIAVTSPSRLRNAPDVPALAETLPGFSAAPNVFVVAPAGTPPVVVGRLNALLRSIVTAQDVAATLEKQGATPGSGTPAELGAQIAEEVKRWATIVKDAGIKAE